MMAALGFLGLLLAEGCTRVGNMSTLEALFSIQEPGVPKTQAPSGEREKHAPSSPASSQDRPYPPDGDRSRTLENLDPERDFPEPVADDEFYGSALADVFEYRPGRGGGDFRWDFEGWYGKDYDRLWYKSEGERDTAFKAEYDIDLQLLYGRLIHPYFDLQAGARIETHSFRDSNVTRAQVALGLEGLLPYFIELESGLFVDTRGRLSGRATLTKDFLLANTLILQGRFETNAALQEVERFGVGTGVNNVEAGLRVRYEFSRRFAPYVGVSLDRSFGETADFVREEGGDSSQVRFVAGIRLLF